MEQAKTTEKEKKEIKINATHTKKYLDMLRETTYKDKEVVFILPSGKEY